MNILSEAIKAAVGSPGIHPTSLGDIARLLALLPSETVEGLREMRNGLAELATRNETIIRQAQALASNARMWLDATDIELARRQAGGSQN